MVKFNLIMLFLISNEYFPVPFHKKALNQIYVSIQFLMEVSHYQNFIPDIFTSLKESD